MSVYEKLNIVQTELKAPKNQRNNFGGYNYRSCEDILEALKPLLYKNKALVTISDEVVFIGSKNYIKATAKFIDAENGESVEVSAFAREAETKKGMDDSQLTGATSSYARKYALNGLFAIDDTKDADYLNTHTHEEPRVLSVAQVSELESLIKRTNTNREQFLSYFKAQNIRGVDYDKAKALLLKKLDKMSVVEAEPAISASEKITPAPAINEALFESVDYSAELAEALKQAGAKKIEIARIIGDKNEVQKRALLDAINADPNTAEQLILNERNRAKIERK